MQNYNFIDYVARFVIICIVYSIVLNNYYSRTNGVKHYKAPSNSNNICFAFKPPA